MTAAELGEIIAAELERRDDIADVEATVDAAFEAKMVAALERVGAGVSIRVETQGGGVFDLLVFEAASADV